MSNIHWEQAYRSFKHNNKEDKKLVQKLLNEIASSDFTFLDANDVQHYANELNSYSNRKDKDGKDKPYTANEIRLINMEAKELNEFDFINSFLNDETDDIIDFF